jgi:hypothetical protein
MYVLCSLVLWRSFRDFEVNSSRPRLPKWCWLLVLALVLFSFSYAALLMAWGLSSLPADRADLINALLLPALMFMAGLQLARSGWDRLLRALFFYALGSLVFVLLSMAISRSPWWEMFHFFEHQVFAPWGVRGPINIRSMEQNAMPALALLPGAVASLLFPGVRSWRPLSRWLALVSALLGLAGLYAIVVLQGRLGVLVLLVASLPAIVHGGLAFWHSSSRWRRWLLLCSTGMIMLLGVQLFRRQRDVPGDVVGWSQGLCDERLSLHLSLLASVGKAPLGGRQLSVPYQLCDGSPATLAPVGGTVQFAHSVILDIFLDAGLLPALLLVAALVPPVVVALRGFWSQWRRQVWNWRHSFLWGWFVLVACQWSFQPLLYSDGLLYYFSFLVLAAMMAGFLTPQPSYSRSDSLSAG